MASDLQLHHERPDMHPSDEGMQFQAGRAPGDDPSILEWEQDTGHVWHHEPGFLIRPDGTQQPPISVVNPDHDVSQVVHEWAWNPAYRSSGGYGNARFDRVHSAVIPGELQVNYLELVSRAPHYGRDALTMFCEENEFFGEPWALSAKIRERFPNPADWVLDIRTRMGMYQAYPAEMQDEIADNMSVAHYTDPAEGAQVHDAAEAFVRFYGSKYEHMEGNAQDSPESWHSRAWAWERLATYVYEKNEWRSFKDQTNFDFDIYVTHHDIMKTKGADARKIGMFSEEIPVGATVPVLGNQVPVLTKIQMEKHGIDGELRCLVAVYGSSWGVIKPTGALEGYLLVPYRDKQFDLNKAIELRGNRGYQALAVDSKLVDQAKADSDFRPRGAEVYWDGDDLLVHRDRAWKKPLKLQSAHTLSGEDYHGSWGNLPVIEAEEVIAVDVDQDRIEVLPVAAAQMHESRDRDYRAKHAKQHQRRRLSRRLGRRAVVQA